jgi:hypothetical protein
MASPQTAMTFYELSKVPSFHYALNTPLCQGSSQLTVYEHDASDYSLHPITIVQESRSNL